MVSFQYKLAKGLKERGIQVCYSLKDKPYQAVLVIGGTHELADLWRVRRQGVRVVQRLDGINWLHRIKKTGFRHFIRAEYGNFILAFIRSRLASGIIYQSRFSQEWWERIHGSALKHTDVVYNGVDLNVYTPTGLGKRPTDRVRVLLVEASLGGGYEMGLETAVQLVERLNQTSIASGQAIELIVAGRISQVLQRYWKDTSKVPIHFYGLVPPEQIPELDRSAHLLYSADINAACPNSVIEAMACGLPVVSFNTGALPELVRQDAGRIADYGGNPWRLDAPDIHALSRAAMEIIQNESHFQIMARARAEEAFSLDGMVEKYREILLDG